MRWVNQISEYWPVKVLATLGEVELRKILSSLIKEESMNSSSLVASSSSPDGDPSWHNNQKSFVSPPSLRSEGKILLVGSGPGHPSLLTRAAYQVLTCPFPNAQSRILSDKLVPSEVLALIPKNIPVYIAKKYPGNSEDAQNELMEMAVEGAKRGETVVRARLNSPTMIPAR
jgi:uroporphyrin-III C-methyltransferase